MAVPPCLSFHTHNSVECLSGLLFRASLLHFNRPSLFKPPATIETRYVCPKLSSLQQRHRYPRPSFSQLLIFLHSPIPSRPHTSSVAAPKTPAPATSASAAAASSLSASQVLDRRPPATAPGGRPSETRKYPQLPQHRPHHNCRFLTSYDPYTITDEALAATVTNARTPGRRGFTAEAAARLSRLPAHRVTSSDTALARSGARTTQEQRALATKSAPAGEPLEFKVGANSIVPL